MKNFLKKSLVIIAMLFSTLSIANLATTAPAYADDPSTNDPSTNDPTCRNFLGLVSWDCGVKNNPSSEDELTNNIKLIITNISKNFVTVASYLVLGYVIYGGYLYILAAGDAGKVATGKKTLTHAFIGLAIVGLTNVIISSIQIAFLGSADAFPENCINEECIQPELLVSNIIQWVIGIAGFVSAAFLVLGGIKYITSNGDAGKLQQAKNTILYALIGLVIVGLAEAIDVFVVNTITEADTGTNIEDSLLVILDTVIGISGLIAVIFIIIGGVNYMTSTGDTNKIQKAKNTILYSVIGLIVCALAYAIVNFAIGTIPSDSDDGDDESSEATSLLEKPIAFLEEKL